jgi:predicted flap endonuclease-1-like 5' DNA nuclease
MTYLITQILLCLLLAFLLGLLLGWWLWSRGCERRIESAVGDWRAKFDRAEADWKSRLAVLEARLAELKTEVEPDDLTRIEGIGPKIQELLYAARIFTFGALSDTSVDRLKEILGGGGERFQMHEPKTWPEQAQLAAEGQWEKLDELQDLLRGGRED